MLTVIVLAELGDCAAVISSQGEVNGITEDYRQDADFYWLTSINEPGASLVLQPKSPYRKVVLFLKPRDPEAERWTGPREPVSPELLVKYGVDRVRRGSPTITEQEANAWWSDLAKANQESRFLYGWTAMTVAGSKA
jgi:Xaa-Pro aminopeptidase